jgi:hypothetical protein
MCKRCCRCSIAKFSLRANTWGAKRWFRWDNAVAPMSQRVLRQDKVEDATHIIKCEENQNFASKSSFLVKFMRPKFKRFHSIN